MSGRPDDRLRLVLLHGAGTDPCAFTHWPADFPDHDVSAPDLQAGLDVTIAGMDDYARAARAALTAPLTAPLSEPRTPPQRTVVCGWSMGGLIALMLATPDAGTTAALSAVVVIEPSLPSQLGGQHPEVPVRQGSYHPDDLYGPSPQGPPTRRESQRAADQRRRGISVPSLAVPLLVIAGQTYPVTRGSDIADFYAGELVTFPDLHHTALVQDSRPRQAIATWLRRKNLLRR